MSRVGVGVAVECERKRSETLSLVFKRFLRGPVGIRGLMGGEQGGGSLFCAQSIDF